MSGGHGAGRGPGAPDGLFHPGTSPVHRLPAEHKVVATVVVAVAVVATPRQAVGAFGLHLALLVTVVALARLPSGLVLRRLRIEVPFLLFALLLPFIGTGPRIEVAGLALSEAGLWAGWNIAVKGTLGVLAAVVLSATTPVPDLLRAARRLRVPMALVGIAGFMVRYLDIIGAEAGRMRLARLSRGDDPRWLWQARATAASAGTLFVRAYERGERVHLAMLSRGFTGTLPPSADVVTAHRGTRWAVVVPLVAVVVAGAAILGR